ncbi:hypothetical protein SCLCIDRAFT_241676 [Scleroderma citrinum Foug A]|uniref:Uncharacterized protein n=1 Tax=Scleroderma citrinum Foug A TaxID=1036808 RepID=A0A0C3D6Y1_9AGAM|nr:hypothetical protein SCLCIDRAFT_241676 [Scleroderma citrinum Foug A]
MSPPLHWRAVDAAVSFISHIINVVRHLTLDVTPIVTIALGPITCALDSSKDDASMDGNTYSSDCQWQFQSDFVGNRAQVRCRWVKMLLNPRLPLNPWACINLRLS